MLKVYSIRTGPVAWGVLAGLILASGPLWAQCIMTSPTADYNYVNVSSQCPSGSVTTMWRGRYNGNLCEGYGNHTGVDIAKGNSDVGAVAEGWVADWHDEGRRCCEGGLSCRGAQPPISAYGTYIVIEHRVSHGGSPEDVFFSEYAHLKAGSIPSDLKIKGKHVSCGRKLGVVGNTGCTLSVGATGTGKHLHFQIEKSYDPTRGPFEKKADSAPVAAVADATLNPRDVLRDADGDGVSTKFGDCDDSNPAIHPGAQENCTNGLDDDCNGKIDSADPACQAPTCSNNGVAVGGFCWFLGVAGASCDATCTGIGKTCDPATGSYAGSGGTDANCQSVLNALGFPGPLVLPSYNCGAGNGNGCEVGGFTIRCASPATTCSNVPNPGYYRACACQ